MAIDKEQIVKTLQLITKNEPDAVVEIRLLPKKKCDRVYAGYFDAESFYTVPNLLEGILKRDRHTAYVTLHRLHFGLLARYYRRFEESPDKTTTDSEIVAYRWLFVDVDPVRPSGINSTDTELEQARLMANDVQAYCMGEMGLPFPIVAMSANGYHLLFPVNEAANKETANYVAGVLAHLDRSFSNEYCKIDVKNFNAARITKLYGCPGGKGDGCQDRPGRLSKIITVPGEMT